MIKVYGAGGWFSPKQAESLNNMYSVIKKFSDIYLFSPKDEVLCEPNADYDTRLKVFDADVHAIDDCDLVIASTEGKDMGTLFECGYAYSNNKPIIYYAELPKGATFNLMLASSGTAVATSMDELESLLIKYKNRNWDFSEGVPYEGTIE